MKQRVNRLAKRIQVAAALAGTAVAVLAGAAFCRAAEPGYSSTPPAAGPAIKTDRGYMIPYEATIPGTEVKFAMLPIPGGKFKLGSPESEAKREAIEGPQIEIEVQPFWMGKYEVTWNEYERYMDAYKPFKDIEALRNLLTFDEKTLSIPDDKREARDRLKPLFDKARADEAALKTLDPADRQSVATLLMFARQRDVLIAELKKEKYVLLAKQLAGRPELGGADAVTAPTKLYSPDQTYTGVEDKRQPAVTMTPFAARQYTKWLSKLTGQTYRLPSEAEWEYACRAGTTTAFSFGDDPAKLGDYAWTYDNSEEKSHVVGQKKPNPWGLYDMHGNAAEWTLDELIGDHYAKLRDPKRAGGIPAWSTVAWPDKSYPRVIRGGGWDSDADRCRSAARTGSPKDKDWKIYDPNIPLSPWWFTEDPARAVGMRLVRCTEPLSKEDAKRCYEIDAKEIAFDVTDRIKVSMRGTVENAGESLPKTVFLVQEINKELDKIAAKFGAQPKAE
jgi:formylglycine-generating enzyme required for sulfatase activity